MRRSEKGAPGMQDAKVRVTQRVCGGVIVQEGADVVQRAGLGRRGGWWARAAVALAVLAAAEVMGAGGVGFGGRGEVELSTGERLRGEIEVRDDGSVVLTHVVLGRIELSREVVAGVVMLEAGEGVPPVVRAAAEEASVEDEKQEEEPVEVGRVEVAGPSGAESAAAWRGWRGVVRGWRHSVEVGGNGSTGNAESMSGRVSVRSVRETEGGRTEASGEYVGARDGGSTTRSRGDVNLLRERKLEASRWRPFARGRAEVDQFAEYDWRLSAFGGVGYVLVARERSEVVVRPGVGGVTTLGGSDDRPVPEGTIGVEARTMLSARTAAEATVEYFPRLEEPSEFRLIGRPGVRVEIDPALGLFLKGGAEWRHDSQPENRKANDLDFFVLLGWTF